MSFLKRRFVVVYVVICASASADVCVKKSACSCVFSNGTGIDISPAASASGFLKASMFVDQENSTEYKLSTYYYHPCVDAMIINPNGTCDKALALCQHVNILKVNPKNETEYYKDLGSYNYLGSSNFTEFSSDGRSIIYNNGPSAANPGNKSTTVLLICAQTGTPKLHVYDESEPNSVVLAFYSSEACLKDIDIGRSLGSTLLIIFFSMVIFYLVLGILTKKFLMGATGIEVIPNLSFWTDLPNLVKDGWAFAISGCKLPVRGARPATSPDPNSYDSI